MLWVLWALVLMVYDAAITLFTRACTSNSVRFNIAASLIANAVCFTAQFLFIDFVYQQVNSPSSGALAAALYILSTTAGGVAMHIFCIRVLEKK